MKSLKKYLKFFIIALLVVASVVVTCVIFFRNLDKVTQKEVSVIAFTDSKTKQSFSSKITSVSNSVKLDISQGNPTDNRFDVMFTTISNLDDSMNFISTYYTKNNGVVTDDNVSLKVESVQTFMNLSISMCDEYVIKSESEFYNKHLGVNDLFDTTSKYIVSYADLIILLNEQISDVDKSVDVRFALIDSYCRVCIDVFSNKETATNGWMKLVNQTNLDYYNTYFKFENSQLKLNDLFADYNTNFVSTYSSCDKANFTKNLKNICQSVGVYGESLTMEQKAAYYFKKVYGI